MPEPQPATLPPLEREGNTIITPDEIADNYANISRGPFKKSKWGKTKRGRKKKSYFSQTDSLKQHLEKILYIPR